MSEAFQALEAENARLRAEMTELRGMFVTNTEKLGTICARVGVCADTPLNEFGPAIEAALRRMTPTA